MLVPELILEELFAQLPTAHINSDTPERQPSFGFGDKHELIKHLVKHGENSYPLIWLLISKADYTGNPLNDKNQQAEKRCTFVIATHEDRDDLLANERFKLSFRHTLNPVTKNVLISLVTSNTTVLIGDKWEISRYTAISDTESVQIGDSTYTIDKWDALQLICDVRFNNQCQNKIQWEQIKRSLQ